MNSTIWQSQVAVSWKLRMLPIGPHRPVADDEAGDIGREEAARAQRLGQGERATSAAVTTKAGCRPRGRVMRLSTQHQAVAAGDADDDAERASTTTRWRCCAASWRPSRPAQCSTRMHGEEHGERDRWCRTRPRASRRRAGAAAGRRCAAGRTPPPRRSRRRSRRSATPATSRSARAASMATAPVRPAVISTPTEASMPAGPSTERHRRRCGCAGRRRTG